MKLYTSLTSPYARKVRILAKEKQLALEIVPVDMAAPNVVSTLNPLGKIPVLERDDGSILFDSPVIAAYVDSLKAPALIPASGEAHWQVLRWEALADGILDATVARMIELRRPAAQQSADAVRKQEGKIAQALAFAEKNIGANWVAGDAMSYADIALGDAIEYIDFRYAHDWRASHPRLASWLARVGARPAFVETQPPH
jgi:glutathione S-transferase